ncbi:DUF5819 family protein [Streptomyces leeuwenhoekii]|uniref:Uncharacterized protein n=1 Tax=Streptomyces leeuwenhoekii TaxID=1437453 RepID=A0A0F7VTL9_STRLW|nr:DUF5819 family protein [Streptomyces leeuwenhoekii]CQR63005.1 Conserved Hypothetical Protein [Streptomyces leeuwenhoekii]
MDAYGTGSGTRQGPDGPGRRHSADAGAPGGAGTAGTGAEAPSGPPGAEPPVRAGAEAVVPVGEATGAGQPPGGLGADPAAAGAPRTPPAAVDAGPAGTAGPPAGVAALPARYQIVAACALALAAVVVCVHLGMLFLHVAPPNTLTERHGDAVDEWIYPEFEQNWKLFAPDPLQQNIAVQVRAEVSTADGGVRTTGWYDLSAEDGRAIDGDPLPSHTRQNQLRRAWDFYVATHDSRDRPVGLRGALAETYLRRIAVLRLERNGAAGPGGVVERVQFRSRTTSVPPPAWSDEKVSARPVHRVLPWWGVPAEETGESREAEGGAR